MSPESDAGEPWFGRLRLWFAEPAAPLSRRASVVFGVLTLALVGATLAWSHTTGGWDFRDLPNQWTAELSVLRPEADTVLRWMLRVGWVGLPLTVLWRTRRWIVTPLATGALFVGTLFAAFYTTGGIGARSWSLKGALTTSRGETYVTFRVRRLCDIDPAVGRVATPGWLSWRVDVLHPSIGRYRGSVLRPDGQFEGEGWHLAEEPSGDAALLDSSGGGVRYCARLSASEEHVRGPVSPFIAFGPDDVGSDAELRSWCRWLGDHRGRPPTPKDAHLVAALRHPSPWVRDAAAQLARAGDRKWFQETLAALGEAE